jgi:hypothetical protein
LRREAAMKVTRSGKKYRSRDEWRQILKRWAGSGQSCKRFCEREGISLSGFVRWRRVVLKSEKNRESKKFIELTPAEAVNQEALRVELQFPNGTVLRIG